LKFYCYWVIAFSLLFVLSIKAPEKKPLKLSKQEFYGKYLKQEEIVDIIFNVNNYYKLNEPEMLIAIAWRESRFNPKARNINANGTNDISVMQMNDRYFKGEYVDNLYVNITLGITHYYNGLILCRGRKTDALRLYNAGTLVRNPRTEKYVSDVLLYALNLNEAYINYLEE
jgi:soluble lytic murein transglycosylase-like protein